MTDTLIKPRDLDWHPQPLHADYRSSLLRSPQHKRLHYAPTQTELTGPVFGHNMLGETGPDGAYSFRTIQPGPYPWPNGGNDWRPAHIHFSVFGDGFAQRLITQMYFEGDPHIALCPIVQSVPTQAGIDRLIARLDMENTVPMDIRAYRFDITLRGREATPFENQKAGT